VSFLDWSKTAEDTDTVSQLVMLLK
jgi:hypothetical protein